MERLRMEYTINRGMYEGLMSESTLQEKIEKEMVYELAQKIIEDSPLTIKKESSRDGLGTIYSAEVFIADESQHRKLVDIIRAMLEHVKDEHSKKVFVNHLNDLLKVK